jgi:hypothetical protein
LFVISQQGFSAPDAGRISGLGYLPTIYHEWLQQQKK